MGPWRWTVVFRRMFSRIGVRLGVVRVMRKIWMS